jgi:DNA polymerase IIIc chi subunit
MRSTAACGPSPPSASCRTAGSQALSRPRLRSSSITRPSIRLADIVGDDEASLAKGRERWRFYRERGYELQQHDLSDRS